MTILIKGDRITLRSLKLSDAEDVVEYCNHKAIFRYTQNIPYPYKRKHAIEFITNSQKNLRKKIGYELGIELDGKIIGGMSLLRVDPIKAEIGYVLGKKYWGKGYAIEAGKLIIDYGFKKLKLKRIWARVAHPNKASLKLLKKLGFKHEGVLRKNMFKNNRYYDEVRFGLLKEEYKRKKKRRVKGS